MVILAAALAVAAIMAHGAWRARRTYDIARDWRAQIRHAIDSGATIGEVQAARTFEASYLEAVFGADQDLLSQMKTLIAKGIAEDPTINLGEVSSMIVTYAKTPEGRVEDVAVHVLGGFEIGKRRPGFNRDGFFAAQIDRNLWNTGNSILSLLGRDLIIFADPDVSHQHDELLESALSGDIMPLVGAITNRPLYFTAVFPDPRRVMPSRLRPHIQACVVKGHLAPRGGSYETLFLTRSGKSADYTHAVVGDLRLAASLALKSRFDGIIHRREWGDYVSTWWAKEWADAVDASILEKQQSVVSVKTRFERPMVNASLKTVERMGRDMAMARLIRDEHLDPRLADQKMQAKKPLHYWSDAHEWGPDWPIPPHVANGAPAVP